MKFHAYTLILGRTWSKTLNDTTTFSSASVDVFARLIRHFEGDGGGSGRLPVPVDGLMHIELEWVDSDGSALAVFHRLGKQMTMAVLLTGSDPADEWQLIAHVQNRMHGQADAAGLPCGTDLLKITERPVIASIPMPVPMDPSGRWIHDMAFIGHMESRLAAAYFARPGGGP